LYSQLAAACSGHESSGIRASKQCGRAEGFRAGPRGPADTCHLSAGLRREAAVCEVNGGTRPGEPASLPSGPIPAVLNRPLHFPAVRPGQRCPASPGKPVKTSGFSGIALGTGPVRVIAGSTRRGIAQLINPTSSPPWLALKTLWFSVPAYQGPFIIRAERLGRPGPVALGEGPTVAPLVVPPGPTMNGTGAGARPPAGCGSGHLDVAPGRWMVSRSARPSSCGPSGTKRHAKGMVSRAHDPGGQRLHRRGVLRRDL